MATESSPCDRLQAFAFMLKIWKLNRAREGYEREGHERERCGEGYAPETSASLEAVLELFAFLLVEIFS